MLSLVSNYTLIDSLHSHHRSNHRVEEVPFQFQRSGLILAVTLKHNQELFFEIVLAIFRESLTFSEPQLVADDFGLPLPKVVITH